MTLTIDRHTGPSGRSYATPYDAAELERAAPLRATVGTLLLLVVGLIALLVVYKPLLAGALVGCAIIGACGFVGVRVLRWRGHRLA